MFPKARRKGDRAMADTHAVIAGSTLLLLPQGLILVDNLSNTSRLPASQLKKLSCRNKFKGMFFAHWSNKN
jgi:hypothetical protein